MAVDTPQFLWGGLRTYGGMVLLISLLDVFKLLLQAFEEVFYGGIFFYTAAITGYASICLCRRMATDGAVRDGLFLIVLEEGL